LPESSCCRLILGNDQRRRKGEQSQKPNQHVQHHSFCLHGNPFLFVDAERFNSSFIVPSPLYNELDGQRKQIFKLGRSREETRPVSVPEELLRKRSGETP